MSRRLGVWHAFEGGDGVADTIGLDRLAERRLDPRPLGADSRIASKASGGKTICEPSLKISRSTWPSGLGRKRSTTPVKDGSCVGSNHKDWVFDGSAAESGTAAKAIAAARAAHLEA